MFSLPTIPLPYRLGLAAIALALSAGAGFFTGWHERSLRADAAALRSAREATQAALDMAEQLQRVGHQQAAITTRTETRFIERAAAAREVTRTLVERIPVYVPRPVDTSLPVGFVRLFNAGAQGVSPVPDPAGRPDDAPSGLALSAALATTLDNDTICRTNAEQLGALQEWVAAQYALAGGQSGEAPH